MSTMENIRAKIKRRFSHKDPNRKCFAVYMSTPPCLYTLSFLEILLRTMLLQLHSSFTSTIEVVLSHHCWLSSCNSMISYPAALHEELCTIPPARAHHS